MQMDAVLITLDQQLAPIFREMDLARLYRISEGEELIDPGVRNSPREPTKFVGRYWYDKRVRDEENQLVRENLNISRRGLLTSRLALGISLILAIAGSLSAYALLMR